MNRYAVLLAGAALAAQSLVASPARADEAGATAARARFVKTFTLANAETCFRNLLAQEQAAQKAAARKQVTAAPPAGLMDIEPVKDITSFDDVTKSTWCSGSPGSGHFSFGVLSKATDGLGRPPLFSTNAKINEKTVHYIIDDKNSVDLLTQGDKALRINGANTSLVRIQVYLDSYFTPKDRAILTDWLELGDRLATVKSLATRLPDKAKRKPAPASPPKP